MASNRLTEHRTEINALKPRIQQIRNELLAKLDELNICIESAEKLNQEAVIMTKTLEDTLTNVSNEATEWQQIKVKLASTVVKGKVILDVGGERYTTSVETLTREKDTYFTALFSRQWQLERDPKDDSIFIDRDGKLFTHILAYLRTDAISKDVMTNESLRQSLILEAKYFHLHKLIEILTEPDRKAEREEAERKEIERIDALFSGGTLLSTEYKKKLSEFYDNTQQKWQLLYKASRDGFDVNVFHNRCNNNGATMTIIQSNNNYLFGGYTSVAWASSNQYAVDSNAFLFTLTNPHNILPTKYPVQPSKTQHAVYHVSGYGPTFGGGNDLCVSTNSNSNNSSYTNFPFSYTDTTGQGNNTFTGTRNFTASDIEVFKLA
jgi:hypothetical protein